MTYNASLNDAFRRVDGSGNGYISAEEIKTFFRDAYLGDIVNDRTLACMIDMADLNGDDEIDYSELSAVIECDDILELAALVPDKKIVAASVKNAKQTVGKYGVTVAVLQKAATTIKDYLNMKYDTVRKAPNRRRGRLGHLTRDEVKAFLVNCYLMKYTDSTQASSAARSTRSSSTRSSTLSKRATGRSTTTSSPRPPLTTLCRPRRRRCRPPLSYKKGAEPCTGRRARGRNAATGFASSL